MDKLFEEGGMADDGMEKDPVSGNEIPPGSTAKEVRDDVDVKLSEGEYVVPADVVQYYGVKFFEDLREKAKGDLEEMDENGRIGGEPVMEDDELTPEEVQMLQEALGPQGMNEGGMVSQPTFSGYGGTNPTVPGAGSQFTGYGGTGAGFGNTGTEIRSYINPDTGQTRSFMFINGQPVGTIPEGFVPNTQENREKAQQTERQTQSVRTEGTRDDGPSFDTATRGTSKGPTFAERMAPMQDLSDEDLANAVKGYSNDISERGFGLLGALTGMGPVGTLAGRGIGIATEAAKGYNTAVEAARRGLEAERAGDTESAQSYMDLATEALEESRWNSALPDIIGTRMTMDDVMTDARRAATIDPDPFALESDLSNFEQALQDAEKDPYGSTVAAEGRFNFVEQAQKDPESMLPPSLTSSPSISSTSFGPTTYSDGTTNVNPNTGRVSKDPNARFNSIGQVAGTGWSGQTSSSSSGGGSSVAGDFAGNVAAGTAGTISMSEFGGGSSSGGSSSSSSSSSGGGFADDPEGKYAEGGIVEKRDGPNGRGGGSGGGCVVATHAVSTGAFTPEDKQRAVDWCRKNLHGNWFGETFRKGYRRVGNKHIDNGTVKNYYTEFEDYVNFVTGKKRNLKGLLTFLYRTPQLFVLGLFTKEK